MSSIKIHRDGLKVLHLLRAPLGGLFRHVRDLASGQSQLGLQVGIVCDAHTGGSFADETLETLQPHCELGIFRLPIRRNPGWSDLRAIRQLTRRCRQTPPDVLHGHGAKGGAYARLLAPRIGAVAICTPHGGSLHYSRATLSGGLYLALERMLKHRTQGMIFESDFARRAYLEKVGRVAAPSCVIRNGLYDREFEALPTETRRYDFVFVGEMRKLKGIDVLLDALSAVRRRRPVTLLMAGSGPDEDRLRARIAELELEDAIALSPPVYPATKAIASGGCVVAPSLAESMPYLVLETIAAGIPILTTKVGGIPEIFGPNAHRLLPPGDPDALAQAMIEVLNDRVGAREDARLLRRHAKSHLRVSQMVQETIDFYTQLSGPQGR